MLDELETFTALYTRLKHMIKGNPVRLPWLADQNPDIHRVVLLVGESASSIQIKLLENPRKSSKVPSGFITAWRDYQSRFKEIIEPFLVADKEKQISGLLCRLRERAEKNGKDFEAVLDNLLVEYRTPGDSFDPMNDDPAELVCDIIDTYHDMVTGEFFSDDRPDKALGAWKFFESTLGFSHKEVYKRWKSVPELFIPRHAASVNLRPIEELYDEAVRTYVYGNYVASIAMCRALLEHILQKHYKIENGNLQDMITIAEGHFRKFRKLGLQKKRYLANRIMHDFEKQSDIEEKSVVEFLKTIRELVKNIPK